jgi:sulfotransferase
MFDFANAYSTIEQSIRNEENKVKSEIFLSSFLDNYYKDVEKPVIIDREKAWGTPANLEIIKKFVNPKPKIIFTVRDILEIIASFIKMDADYLKREVYQKNGFINNYRSQKDIICEHLMSPLEDIDKSLLSLASAFYPENKGIFHIVEYRDLISKPEETMNGIYEFLEMPHYSHNFKKIEKLEKDNDEILGLPKNLHDIKKSLSKSSTDTDILSDYIKHKYSNMEFWRKGSLMKVRGKDF